MKAIFLFALLALGAGCVTPPSPQAVRDAGFRTPEGTFETLRIAVAAEMPRLEYQCLSSGFRARFDVGRGLSQLAYRELRDEVLSKRLEFWLGIPDAELGKVRPLGPGRCLLRASSHGHAFELVLVREDFWELWAEDELLADVLLPHGSFPRWAEVFQEPGGRAGVSAAAALPPELAARDLEELGDSLTEFRIGREWKIDEIVGLEEALLASEP